MSFYRVKDLNRGLRSPGMDGDSFYDRLAEHGAGSVSRIADESVFPKSLRDWSSESELAIVVAEVASSIETCDGYRTFLLAVISYSYASGVYASEEIERSLHRVQNELDWPAERWVERIRHYRRNYRTELESCLVEILRHVAGGGAFSDQDLAKEATLRVRRAIQEDSWALDF